MKASEKGGNDTQRSRREVDGKVGGRVEGGR